METTERGRQELVIAINLILRMQIALLATGQSPVVVVVASAIRLGQLQRKPVDASDISYMIGAPRTTVLRHIEHLRKIGRVRSSRVGRRIIMATKAVDGDTLVNEFYRDILGSMRVACAAMSKLDSLEFD